jgi:hypothetical protein
MRIKEATQRSGVAFDPKTIGLLKKVLADAEQTLPMQGRSSEARVKLATGILDAAAKGERDPARLRPAALDAVRTVLRSVPFGDLNLDALEQCSISCKCGSQRDPHCAVIAPNARTLALKHPGPTSRQ